MSRTRVAPNTVISEVRCRETGATIRVERTGEGSWIEQEEGWATICLNHATCVIHYSRADARSHAACPSGWCEECRNIADDQAPRITEPYQYCEEDE